MITSVCAIGDRLRAAYLVMGEQKAKLAYVAHIQKCPACRAYIDKSFQQAKNAVMPEFTE